MFLSPCFATKAYSKYCSMETIMENWLNILLLSVFAIFLPFSVFVYANIYFSQYFVINIQLH